MALKSNGVTQVPDGLGTPGQVLKVNSAGTAGEWGSIATTDNTKLPLAGGTMTGDVLYNDNIKAKFGTDSDLQIYHDGTNGYLKNDTGKFRILGDQGNVAINVAAGGGNAVSLEYANSTKLQTTSSGVSMMYGATFGSGGDTILSNYQNGTSGQRYFQAKNDFQSGITDGSIFGGMSFRNSRGGTNTGITGYMRGVANGTSGNMNLEIVTGTAGSLTQKVLIKDAGVDITGDLTVNGDATFFKNTGGSSTYDFVSDHYAEIALTADYDGSHGGPHITSLIANGSTGSLAMRTKQCKQATSRSKRRC